MIQEAEEKNTFVDGTSQQEENCFFSLFLFTNVLDHGSEVSEDMQILRNHL